MQKQHFDQPHGNAIPAESRANKVIAVTQTVLAHVRAHQQVGEIPDDTLRRLLGFLGEDRHGCRSNSGE